jgi:hypothetical protein
MDIGITTTIPVAGRDRVVRADELTQPAQNDSKPAAQPKLGGGFLF